MPIIVLNLTNLPINSATSNAGFNYSVHNAISPNHYYIHDTVPGTFYDIRIRWSLNSPAYESDIAHVVSIVTGVAIGLLGLALAPFTAGWTLGATGYVWEPTLATVGLAMAKVGAPLTVKLGADGIIWKVAKGNTRAANDIRKGDIKGADTTVLVVEGKVPFQTTTVTKDGKEVITEITSKDPSEYPLTVRELDMDSFNEMRSSGKITQSRIPILADLNALLGTVDKKEQKDKDRYTFELAPETKIQSNRRYLIENYHPGSPAGLLSAHDSESDEHFFRRLKSEAAKLPESQWQFVPYMSLKNQQGGNATGAALNVFAICERRYGKFLCYDKKGQEVQMRFPLNMQDIRIGDEGGYLFDIDFESHYLHPQMILVNNSHRITNPGLIRSLDWTPFFALVPGTQSGYFYITPYLPQTDFATELTPQFYKKMKDEGPFIAAGDGSEDRRIWTLANHRTDSMDQWKFVEVVD